MQELKNPASIKSILEYAKSTKTDFDNKYISKIRSELLKLNFKTSKNSIVTIFQLFRFYCGAKNYIDVSCTFLALCVVFKHRNENVFINVKTGHIAISKDTELHPNDMSNVAEIANSLKQIIIEIFAPMGPD